MKPEDTRDARDNHLHPLLGYAVAAAEGLYQGTQAMTVTVQLPSELVESLRAVAERAGQDLDSTIAGMLAEQLQGQAVPSAPAPPQALTESELLQQIQRGLPETTWERYHELQARREAEQLSPAEHRELIALTDEIEGWNVRRLELAQQLAACRGVSWQQVVAELGLGTPASR